MPQNTHRQEVPRKGCVQLGTTEGSSEDSQVTDRGACDRAHACSLILCHGGHGGQSYAGEDFPGGPTQANPGLHAAPPWKPVSPVPPRPGSVYSGNHATGLKADHRDVDREESFPLQGHQHLSLPRGPRGLKRQVIPATERTACPSCRAPLALRKAWHGDMHPRGGHAETPL